MPNQNCGSQQQKWTLEIGILQPEFNPSTETKYLQLEKSKKEIWKDFTSLQGGGIKPGCNVHPPV